MATSLQRQSKVLSLQQVNAALLQIVNSIYLDKADAIVSVPVIEGNGNITFRFRDNREIYDATITNNDRLSYVESGMRGDSYLEGVYLSEIVPVPMPRYYTQGIIDTQINFDAAKRRRCQKGKPCGEACVEKGDVCDRKLPENVQKGVDLIRNALSSRLALGLGAAALVGAGAIAFQNTRSSPTAAPPASSPTRKSQPTQKQQEELLSPPQLTAVASVRPNSYQIEVIRSRPGTPEEVRQFKPEKERRKLEVTAINNEVIVPDPRRSIKYRQGASNAIEIKGFDNNGTMRIANALERVDEVFPSLPNLPAVPLVPSTDNRHLGLYTISNYIDKDTNELIDRLPKSIELNSEGNELTVIHEVGHYLDHTAVGTTKNYLGTASLPGLEGNARPLAVFDDFFEAVNSTPTMKRIVKKQTSPNPAIQKHNQYLVRRSEVFARAFAQYTTKKSNSGVLKAQLKAEATTEKDKYWSDKEFKNLEPVMDRLFNDLGWRT